MDTRAFVFLAVLCVVLPAPSTSSLTAYDCSSKTHITTIPIPDLLGKCEAITRSRPIYATIVQLPTTTISAYRCHITYTQSLVDSQGSSRFVSTGTHTVKRDVCLEAHASKTIDLDETHIPFLNDNGTTKHNISKIDAHTIDGNSSTIPRSYYYQRSYDITLSKMQGTLEWDQNILRFEGLDCDYNNFSCDDDLHGQLFWKPGRDGARNVGSLYSGVVYLVRMNKTFTRPEVTYAIINFQDKVFALKCLDYITDDNTAFRTEVEDVFIIPQGGFIMFTASPGMSPKTKGWETVYSENLDGSLGSDATDVVKRLCEAENVKFFRSIESTVPSGLHESSFKTIEFPRMGIIGNYFWRDRRFIEVTRCAQRRVYRRQSDECFNVIPVRDEQNKTSFLDPFTRILTDRAEAIDCRNNSSEEATVQEASVVRVVINCCSSQCLDVQLGLSISLGAVLGFCIMLIYGIVKLIVKYDRRQNL